MALTNSTFNLVTNCAEKKNIIKHPIINEIKITCYTQNQSAN